MSPWRDPNFDPRHDDPDYPFTCPRCGAASMNPNDARERYCGACHRFAAPEPRAYCHGCGAEQEYGRLRCSECGNPFVFPAPPDPYQDDRFVERPCDKCGKPYRGPAVYCSLECALEDA